MRWRVTGLFLMAALAAPEFAAVAFGQSLVGLWTTTAATPGGHVSDCCENRQGLQHHGEATQVLERRGAHDRWLYS
jgi:hypothetical protein